MYIDISFFYQNIYVTYFNSKIIYVTFVYLDIIYVISIFVCVAKNDYYITLFKQKIKKEIKIKENKKVLALEVRVTVTLRSTLSAHYAMLSGSNSY